MVNNEHDLYTVFSWQEPQHDYHPSWDYEPKEPSCFFVALLKKAFDYVLNFTKDFGIDSLQVYVIDLQGEAVGRFIYGTFPFPVVVVDPDCFERFESEQDALDELKITLLHELAHSFLENGPLEPEQEESIVEHFARCLVAGDQKKPLFQHLVSFVE